MELWSNSQLHIFPETIFPRGVKVTAFAAPNVGVIVRDDEQLECELQVQYYNCLFPAASLLQALDLGQLAVESQQYPDILSAKGQKFLPESMQLSLQAFEPAITVCKFLLIL